MVIIWGCVHTCCSLYSERNENKRLSVTLWFWSVECSRWLITIKTRVANLTSNKLTRSSFIGRLWSAVILPYCSSDWQQVMLHPTIYLFIVKIDWHCCFDRHFLTHRHILCISSWLTVLLSSPCAVEEWLCQWLGEDPQLPWDSGRMPRYGCARHDKDSQGETSFTTGYLPHDKVLVKNKGF